MAVVVGGGAHRETHRQASRTVNDTDVGMTPLDPDLARLVEELSNALQSAVLLVEHLERTSAATTRDVRAINVSLKRATDVLGRLRRAVDD
jgi:hypothetical protein